MLLDTTLYMYVMKSGYGTRACMYEISTNQEIRNCFHGINTFFQVVCASNIGLVWWRMCVHKHASNASGKYVPHFY